MSLAWHAVMDVMGICKDLSILSPVIIWLLPLLVMVEHVGNGALHLSLRSHQYLECCHEPDTEHASLTMVATSCTGTSTYHCKYREHYSMF